MNEPREQKGLKRRYFFSHASICSVQECVGTLVHCAGDMRHVLHRDFTLA